jgi:hypothetical protein
MLPRIAIKTLCTASWDEMKGDDVSRFCFACSKTVYDLDAMGEDAAEAFLERHLDAEGVLPCLRLYRRRDGRVLTSECAPAARRRHARRAALVVPGTFAAAIATAFAVARATEPALGPDVDDGPATTTYAVSIAQHRIMMGAGALVEDREPGEPDFDEIAWAESGGPENDRLGTSARTHRLVREARVHDDQLLAAPVRLVR